MATSKSLALPLAEIDVAPEKPGNKQKKRVDIVMPT
jgi:hypothetical protein